MAKVKLNAANYIIPYRVFENIRVNPVDDTQIDRIPLGGSEWETDSHNYESSKAAALVASFEEFTGTIPTFDWDNYKYKVVDTNIVQEPL